MPGFLPQEIIRAKRDGNELAADEIEFFVGGVTDGSVGEGQAAAFAMSVFLRGMTRAETVALTVAMRDSGRVMDWRDLPGPVADKHSTGGVGDKVSLVLAPVLAACGVFVPMLSGRGLGHTGGTLDKLESIPGYVTQPDLDRLRRTVRAAGCAIIGQTDDLAPADRRLYAIRDVTATVESIPLITASILAKKLAAGLQALVMDVKCGSGAFMPGREQARALAGSIVGVARGAGLPTTALLTDMGQCLGHAAGNALEVAESVAMLRGEPAHPRLRELVLHLCGEALALAGVAANPKAGQAAAAAALDSGAAAERFAAMVRELGGPGDLLDHPRRHLPRAPLTWPVFAREAGHVRAVDARALGLAVVELGGGRRHASHPVDHAVGLSEVRGVGETAGPDAPLALVHGRDEGTIAAAEKRLLDAYIIGGAPDLPPGTILERVG
jgi:thymidine phosphorylase